MDRSHNLGSRRGLDEPELNLKEWHLRARISRENTLSRRYSASYIRSFRHDSTSFRSNFTISSTASSPGHLLLKDEIDPSTYSFTTALRALQARSGYVWEWLSPDNQVFALNSKWDEAERYICNPLSGEVPMECLSSKTLSGRSFRSSMAARVTMSAPLVFSANPIKRTPLNNINNNIIINNSNNNNNNNKPAISSASVSVIKQQIFKPQFPPQEEKKMVVMSKTRDVGTQSTLALEEEPNPRSILRGEETEDRDGHKVEEKATREEEETKRGAKEGRKNKKKNMSKKKTGKLCNCRQISGCFLLPLCKSLWIKNKQP